MKWANLKFFQVIGFLGFGVGVGNAWGGYQNRATAQELVNNVNRLSRDQGLEVGEKYASSLYRILYQNNSNNQHFQTLIRSIDNIKQNDILISSYQTVLRNPSLDAVTWLNYEAEITRLHQANQLIIHQLSTNHEMMQRLNESIAIDNSVILQELDNLRRGGVEEVQVISL